MDVIALQYNKYRAFGTHCSVCRRFPTLRFISLRLWEVIRIVCLQHRIHSHAVSARNDVVSIAPLGTI